MSLKPTTIRKALKMHTKFSSEAMCILLKLAAYFSNNIKFNVVYNLIVINVKLFNSGIQNVQKSLCFFQL